MEEQLLNHFGGSKRNRKTRRNRKSRKSRKSRKTQRNKESMLTNNDYKKILQYYHENIPESRKNIKLNAENIIATKLCRCIKKVDKANEARAIGICTKTIINNKGFTRGNFKCKGKPIISMKKIKIDKNAL